jgi:hypothetical protein
MEFKRFCVSQTIRLWKNHDKIKTVIKHAIKELQNVWVLQKPLPLDDPPPSTPAAPCHC